MTTLISSWMFSVFLIDWLLLFLIIYDLCTLQVVTWYNLFLLIGMDLHFVLCCCWYWHGWHFCYLIQLWLSFPFPLGVRFSMPSPASQLCMVSSATVNISWAFLLFSNCSFPGMGCWLDLSLFLDLLAFSIGCYVIWSVAAGARYSYDYIKTKRVWVLLSQISKWCAIVLKSFALLSIWVSNFA